jgi:hypothetical protein
MLESQATSTEREVRLTTQLLEQRSAFFALSNSKGRSRSGRGHISTSAKREIVKIRTQWHLACCSSSAIMPVQSDSEASRR